MDQIGGSNRYKSSKNDIRAMSASAVLPSNPGSFMIKESELPAVIKEEEDQVDRTPTKTPIKNKDVSLQIQQIEKNGTKMVCNLR